MGKPTKTRQPSKVDSQSKHGHQSSIDSFFKKKSELPSPLFTQVISTSQKGLKKKKKEGLSSQKSVFSVTPKVFKHHTASSLPSTDQQDPLVIPATPESMQSSPKDSSHSPPEINNEDMAGSPFSQTIIPDTPDNVLPKKRPFTSLMNHPRDISGSSIKQNNDSRDSSQELKFSKEVERLPMPLLCATNSEIPKMKMNLKGSVMSKENEINKNRLKVEKKLSPSGAEKTDHNDNGQPRPTNKLSRLSRKGNKVAKLNNGAASKPVSGFENGQCNMEELAEPSSELPQKCQENSVELKPAVCRMRNSTKKNASRLSLSSKVHKDLLKTSIRAVKRSPSRGNSPYSKRFQDSEDTQDDMEHGRCGDGVERVKKSLLEEYGSERILNKTPSLLTKAADCSANIVDSLKSCTKDAEIAISSSGKASSSITGCLADQLSGSDKSLFSDDNNQLIDQRTSPAEGSACCSLPSVNKVIEQQTDVVSKEIRIQRYDDELEEFVSTIPDSCPTQTARHQDVLTIPDTCPITEDTPENMKATRIQSLSKVSGSPVHEKVTLGTPASQGLEQIVQSKVNTANQSCDLTLEHHSSVHEVRKGREAPSEADNFGKSPQYETIENNSVDAIALRKSIQSSASGLAGSLMIDESLQGTTSTDVDIVEETPLVITSKDKSSPGKPHHGSLNPGANVSSPGTAALLEGLDDSFLDGIDLDELDDVQDSKIKGNSVSGIGKKFAEMSPFKTKPTEGSKLSHRPADLCRYLVTGIQDSNYEKKLSIRSMSDQRDKICILKDTWQGTLIEEGMVVAIHGTFSTDGICKLNNQSGYLVVNPDHLLTGTAVSNSIRCMRRSVLSENFKGLERGNRAMLLGSLLHEVFDQAILQNQFQKAQLMQIARDILKQPAFLCDMYSLKVDENNLLEEVEEYADTIKRWSDTYLGSTPKGNVDIKWPGSFKSENCGVGVSKVTDIEETIWSPRWGVKGKVDLTVEVKIHRPSSRPAQHVMPLELKTGRETNSIEHRSQLILYSLMLGDLQSTSDLGFLLYLKTASMKSVPANHLDKRELVHLRNQLAYYLSRTARSMTTPTVPSSADWPSQTAPSLTPPILPEPIRDDFTCKRCAHLQACSSLHKLESSPTQLSSSVQELFKESIEHIPDSHLQYFAHWYLLCCLEHEATQKRNNSKNIWCKESIDREKDGECWSNMKFISCTPKDQQNGGFSLLFRRKQGMHGDDEASLDKCLMRGGDRVVISEEESRRVALGVGFIESVSKEDVKISSDSQLKKDGARNLVYRIDKDDSYNSMAASLVNLTKIMKPEHNKLRNIVIDKQPPTSVQKPNLPSRARGEVATIMRDLNEDQRAAIKAVLRSQDYTLIIGMPGTGKTTTIVALVRILVACGMSVLLTSYTHSAVDNILLKLIKHKIDILRLGAQHNVHPDVRQFSDTKLMKETPGVSQLATQMERKKVVATTSLGMKHALFTRHSFDVCIVDEASQISQIVCLGPLFSASKFVLVGDQCQLPPLVQSTRARNLGMDESLFQRLVSAHKSSAVSLSLQFRMNSKIMAISNHMVYDGAMRCGNDIVSKATVSLPNWDEWCEESQMDSWLVDSLNPSTVVSFLNTDQVSGLTNESTPGNTNSLEASLVTSIVQGLMQAGCSATHIGVISPYRRQCQLLVSTLADLGSKAKSVEVNTVDKYQGRDKDVIVVSFSHRSMESQGGSILNDLRRLNVAMTRAKHKLLLIGSMKCLAQFEPVQKLIGFLQQHQLVRNLPHDAINN